MGLVPGMPNLAFLTLAIILIGGAYYIEKNKAGAEEVAIEQAPMVIPEAEEASWKDISPVDVIGLEVGYRLIPLVDYAQDGELLKRIKGLRKKFTQVVGFLSPTVHIKDNLELKPSGYRITLKGVEIASGESYHNQFLAINPGMVTGNLPGLETTDPAFGLPATWINADIRDQAQGMGYTVVDASTVIATHLNQVINMHASELLGRDEVQQLLDLIAKESPKLIEELVPKQLTLSVVQKVLQNLLVEGVNIRDMRTILETLAEYASRTQNPEDLTTAVRVQLGRSIVQQLFPNGNEISVITLDNQLERLLMQSMQSNTGNGSAIEPGLADTLAREAESATRQQENLGITPVLLVSASLRTALSKFLRRAIPQLRVLSHEELPDSKTIRVTSLIGGPV